MAVPSGRIVRPITPETKLGEHGRRIQALEKRKGPWIYVGTYPGDTNTSPESPPFQNSWGNVLGGLVLMRFRHNMHGGVDIEGAVTGGASETTIFTLPADYRPDYNIQLVCSDGNTGTTNIQVNASGEVIWLGAT